MWWKSIIYIGTQLKCTKRWKQSASLKQLLEILLLVMKICIGFTTDVKWVNTKLYIFMVWVGLLMVVHTFVFTHIISVVKPMDIFMARIRVSKSCLKAELYFHRFAHFACVPICIFGFYDKQRASRKDFTLVKFTRRTSLRRSSLEGLHFSEVHHSNVQ